MNEKPVIKYYMDEVMGAKLIYKQTFLATIKGPLARIFIDAKNRGLELVWSYDYEHRKIDIYLSELLDPVQQQEMDEVKRNI